MKPKDKPPCKHKKWTFIAESRYSYNEWCEECGAWKRHDLEEGRTTIMLPKVKSMKPETYSKAEVKELLQELYDSFVGRLSDGEDCLYAKFLRDAKKEIEKENL